MIPHPLRPILAVYGCVLFAGCAKSPTPHAVAGAVTLNGQPVPFGKVYFDPDPKTNPDSPQGFADIKDGQFDTAKGGRGTKGGTFTVRIEGFDGRTSPAFPYGHMLFDDYKVKVELPAENTKKDFDVPATAARKGPAVPSP